MSHPDLLVAAKLVPEDPLVQLGRYAVMVLKDVKLHPDPRIYNEAVRLGLIPKE